MLFSAKIAFRKGMGEACFAKKAQKKLFFVIVNSNNTFTAFKNL
jgi:hypothetical protein